MLPRSKCSTASALGARAAQLTQTSSVPIAAVTCHTVTATTYICKPNRLSMFSLSRGTGNNIVAKQIATWE
jgi:hypothetical protein